MMFLFFNNSISAGTADTVSAVCRPRPRQAGGQRRQNQLAEPVLRCGDGAALQLLQVL